MMLVLALGTRMRRRFYHTMLGIEQMEPGIGRRAALPRNIIGMQHLGDNGAGPADQYVIFAVSSVQTGGSGKAAIGDVAGHLVIGIAEQAGTAGGLGGDIIADSTELPTVTLAVPPLD